MSRDATLFARDDIQTNDRILSEQGSPNRCAKTEEYSKLVSVLWAFIGFVVEKNPRRQHRCYFGAQDVTTDNGFVESHCLLCRLEENAGTDGG